MADGCEPAVDMRLGELAGPGTVARRFYPEMRRPGVGHRRRPGIALRDVSSQLDWMSRHESAAIAKLNAFARKIGYPDRWIDYLVQVSRATPRTCGCGAMGRAP